MYKVKDFGAFYCISGNDANGDVYRIMKDSTIGRSLNIYVSNGTITKKNMDRICSLGGDSIKKLSHKDLEKINSGIDETINTNKKAKTIKSKKVKRDINLKKEVVKVGFWFSTLLLLISGVKNISNKILNSKNVDYSIEKNIDDDNYDDSNSFDFDKNEGNIIEENKNGSQSEYNEEELYEDNSKIEENNNLDKASADYIEKIDDIDDKDTIDYQEEDNKYYYNLDGEVDRQNWNNVMRYEDVFKKAGEKYGIDYKLLMAIACQESSGIHKNNKYSYGIMHVERVHKDEELAVNNMITGEVDTLKGTDEYLSSLYGNTEFGAGILQRCLNIAYREGYEKGILKKNEIIPVALHGYNMGFDAEKEMIDNYAKSGEESYNYFIRITISTNIEDEALVWHLKYPALVFNECGEENTEYWAYCKSSNGEIEKVFTTPINESKIFTASMRR